jgi:16S rRNA (guanine527-N7)-methyltransferase
MSAAALDTYACELRRWNRAVNLVSPATLDNLEARHINDSRQLLSYLPDRPVTLMDWGSGGGLPGIVVALSRPDCTVHLVESDQKKCEFLRHVSRETKIPFHVHNVRIEDLDPYDIKIDIITARALAPLPRLLEWMCTYQQTYPHLYALFLKGKSWREEVLEAEKSFIFKMSSDDSAVDSEGRVLRINHLTKRTESEHDKL